MKCHACGHINPEGYGFCEECGESIASQTQTPPSHQPGGESSKVRCPSCNEPNPAHFRYCAACGESLPAAIEVPPASPAGESLSIDCASCGAPIRAGVLFCESCGASLAELKDSKRCPACGAFNHSDFMFCGTCGETLFESMEQKCPACGALNHSEFMFCGTCGEALSVPILQQCTTCGSEIRAGVRFCEECGEPVKEIVRVKPPRPAVRWRIPVWAWVLGGVAVVLIVVGGLVDLNGDGSSSSIAGQPRSPNSSFEQSPTSAFVQPQVTQRPYQTNPTPQVYEPPTEAPPMAQPTTTDRPLPPATERPPATPMPTELPHQFGFVGQSTVDFCKRENVVCVAVLDSGVNIEGNLVGRVVEGFDLYGSGTTSDLCPNNNCHGTSVAQTVSSVFPSGYIIPIRTPWNLLDEAIEKAVDLGADIINISMYGSYSGCDSASDNLRIAIGYADAWGVPIFGAATCGLDTQTNQCTKTGRYAPADCQGIIGVGATYNGQIRYNQDQDVIFEVSGQYGPSWAAAYVSGSAGNMISAYPHIYRAFYGTDLDDNLLLALTCRAYHQSQPNIELACSGGNCGWAGILFECENYCTLDWCP